MATHSSILAWRIPWKEEPGGLQSMGLQRVLHDLATEHTCTQRKEKVKNCTLLQLLSIGKGVCHGCILSPCLFNLYADASREMLGWMRHKLKSRLLGEVSITSDMPMTPPLWQKLKKN